MDTTTIAAICSACVAMAALLVTLIQMIFNHHKKTAAFKAASKTLEVHCPDCGALLGTASNVIEQIKKEINENA